MSVPSDQPQKAEHLYRRRPGAAFHAVLRRVAELHELRPAIPVGQRRQTRHGKHRAGRQRPAAQRRQGSGAAAHAGPGSGTGHVLRRAADYRQTANLPLRHRQPRGPDLQGRHGLYGYRAGRHPHPRGKEACPRPEQTRRHASPIPQPGLRAAHAHHLYAGEVPRRTRSPPVQGLQRGKPVRGVRAFILQQHGLRLCDPARRRNHHAVAASGQQQNLYQSLRHYQRKRQPPRGH